MPKPICELAPREVAAWRDENKKPDCRQHRHISKIEACEKTCHGDYRGYFARIAEWVGPRAIVVKADRRWAIKESDHCPGHQLVEGTDAAALRQSKPQPMTQFVPRGLPSIRARKPSRFRRSLFFSLSTSIPEDINERERKRKAEKAERIV